MTMQLSIRPKILSLLLIILLASCSRHHNEPFSAEYDPNFSIPHESEEEREENRFNGLLVHEQYQDLDEAFADAEKQYHEHKISGKDWERRWYSIANINADGIKVRFDSWVAQTGSGYAYLARGMLVETQAWETRGDKYALHTPPDKLAEFQRLSALAEPDILTAKQKIIGCGICNAELININRALSRPVEDSKELLDSALVYDPMLSTPVFAYFMVIFPQWYGSFDEMDDFISEMKNKVKDPSIIAELQSLYCWDKALFLSQDHNIDGAISWYEKGLTTHPSSKLLLSLAYDYSQQRGQYKKAIALLQQNLKLYQPTDIVTIEALAQGYFAIGEQKKGETMMQYRDDVNNRYNTFQ
jgi:tetratricopeptide (TPR) repeat protein